MSEGVFRPGWYPRPVRDAAARGAVLSKVAAASPKFETLTDDFTGTTIDTGKWAGGVVGSVTQSNELTIPTTNAAQAGVLSGTLFTLKESYLYLKITSFPADTAAQFHLYLVKDDDNYVELAIAGDVLQARSVAATVDTNATGSFSLAGSPPWLRISETGGTVYWDGSQDGTTWAPLWTNPTPTWLTTTTLMYAQVSTFNGTGGQSYKVDNLNVAPTPPVGGVTRTARGTDVVATGTSSDNVMVSSSFTPAAGEYVLAAVTWIVQNTSATITPTDNFGDTGGGTWQSITNTQIAYTTYRIGVGFYYRKIGTGAGAGTITITRTAGSVDQTFTSSFYQYAGADLTTPVRQSNTGSQTDAGSGTVNLNLASTPLTDSSVLSIGLTIFVTGPTIPSGHTTLSDLSAASGGSHGSRTTYDDASAGSAIQWSAFGANYGNFAVLEFQKATTPTLVLPDVRVAGAWVTPTACKVRVGGAWVTVTGVKVRVSGAWVDLV